MRYTFEKTVLDFPFRWLVRKNGELVALTFTKWGARRLVRRMRSLEESSNKRWDY